MPLPRISALSLNVSDPSGLSRFYCDVLGMNLLANAGGAVSLGYAGEDARLELVRRDQSTPYQPDRNDRYWKIAITLPDLDVAFAQLRSTGIDVTEPAQFRDIAYMSHLADPEGHVIELIQHTFHGKPKTKQGNVELPLGGGARIGLITLRTDDIETELMNCHDTLGMRYLSRQDLADLGFCLYFLAYTEDTPPDTDVNAVENREWLWQRPYTVLEFQHLFTGEIRQMKAGERGASSVLIDEPGGERKTVR